MQSLAWATQHSLEICQALVESLLKTAERKQGKE
ncbi:hypothetical protein PSEMO_62000 [Pseudomonas putida]|uniref:Uncharacterized protein n=1 Tax=Pseudomonas putida TaxID=303 RepID=A0A1Q9QUM5_PSEPU|nr:hypothetical protein PSEMO_62000 [Pseudomonas putida]